ncbi:Sodium/hydrogen exchanger [Coniochaeta ligniaria NRRL 30616]|uniref:Sodium/hydrogen exchanger n=1 Tax=Coniochaeta ligniaria NRRL 30616 TaxID=1408157 RepID=A0A1J7II15_9PEZI|nr:Sodium/hydrogen exchanger [Coniochaeta ligniaria NRRL 30616]
MPADPSGAFLEYHEPDVVSILTLISFFILLAVSEWLSNKIFRAGLIGQIVVGLIYGVPIANILALEWQEAFLALGYVGLILIIFEGGLTIRLDLLRQNLILSILAALLGVLAPISLSFALLYAGFGHAPLEAFIVGVALCSTSLGTTFVVINSASASRGLDFSQTRIGTVLLSAAVLDDVCGLVLVSVIRELRDIAPKTGGGSGGTANLGWVIGRPILASGLMAALTPTFAHFAFRPLLRLGYVRSGLARDGHASNIVMMVLVLCAFLAIAAYAGASVLFGSFLAGMFLSMLREPQTGKATSEAVGDKSSPMFSHTFEKYLADVQRFVLQPLFFASVGFAIPFLELWTGEVIWKGIVFSILMVCAKLVVGLCVPLWDLAATASRGKAASLSGETLGCKGILASTWAPATLLGTAMVSRGEIGLIIAQIGLNETPYLGQKAFVIAIWAIVLNTIIGPVSAGFLIKTVGQKIAEHPRWGVRPLEAKRESGLERDVERVGRIGEGLARGFAGLTQPELSEM